MAAKKKSKAAPKKAAPKKLPVKKSTPKKAAKRVAKRVAKASSKRPAKKSVAQKAKLKKAAARKKAAPKKLPVKKSTPKKAAAKRPAARTSTSTLLIRDAMPTRVEEFKLQTPAPAPTPAPQAPEAERKRLPFFLFAAIIGVVALIAVSLGGDGATDNEAQPIASESPSASPSESVSPSESPEVIRLLPPQSVYADYTPIGGVVTWKAPQGDLAPTQYLVQASYKGQGYKTIATLGPDTRKLELMKIDTPSETVFRVVAVYQAGEAKSDISSIKGQYEVMN